MTTPTQGEHAQTEALDDLYLKLHGMSKHLESSGRIDESDAPEAYPAILDAMNLVRRLQSEAAQVPATTAQPVQDYAELLESDEHIGTEERNEIAAELRRLHAYCQELESQVIRDCMTHVQNPAEIEHVANDVSKNGAELNMTQQPATSAAAAAAASVEAEREGMRVAIRSAIHASRYHFSDPIRRDVADRVLLDLLDKINARPAASSVAAPQPSPTAQAAPAAGAVAGLADVAALRVKAVQACANANGRDWEFMYSGHQDEQVVAWLDGYSAGQAAAPTPAAQADSAPAEAVQRIVHLRADRERRVYVAGPMTGLPEYNFPLFNATAAKLRGEGWHVENPAEHGHVEGACWADYLRWDISRIATCGAIYLLPGWEKSKGAHLEVHIAGVLGLRVLLADGAEVPPADSVLEDAAPQPAIENPYRAMTGRHEAFEQGVLKTLAAFRAKHAARKQGGKHDNH